MHMMYISASKVNVPLFKCSFVMNVSNLCVWKNKLPRMHVSATVSDTLFLYILKVTKVTAPDKKILHIMTAKLL